jgi:hypothetical protein
VFKGQSSAVRCDRPSPANAYNGVRNLVIKTTSAKEITELAFGTHLHGLIGKNRIRTRPSFHPASSSESWRWTMEP